MASARRFRGIKKTPFALLGLLALVATLGCWSQGFAAPRASHAQQTEVLSGSDVATGSSWRSAGNFAGSQYLSSGAAAPKPWRSSGSIAGDLDARGTDSISMLLAAAGAATAMKAMSVARRAEGEAAPKEEQSAFEKYKVMIYIGLWYVFNIGYNIYNKKALLMYPYPWACALWQMAFGLLIFVPMWLFGIRKTPKMTTAQMIKLSPSAFGHLATHVGAVMAFFAGAVSFGHIVKASEPVVSCVLNAVFCGEVLKLPVYAALLPIIGGVGLASASELSFNWLCFGAAMGSNIGSAARGVYSKKVMDGGNIGENMNASNVYGVLTIMATIMLIPICCAITSPAMMIEGFKAAHAAEGAKFLWAMFYSGLYYYLYNEVAFLALGQLDPVSHAVSNTMKRVVIIITSIIVFRTPVTPLGVAGSSIAIAGTLLYSLAKNKYK